MIHVPNVQATVDWYQRIGFTVLNTYGNDADGLSFAILSFGSSQVMFSQGGQPSSSFRREVDLYVYADGVDELYKQLKEQVEVVEGPHDTFYGMREFIIRDNNRFWMTFGEPSVFEVLMAGVKEGKTDLVRAALESGKAKPETLRSALAVALTAENRNPDIIDMLRRGGATASPELDLATLNSYVGTYQGERGLTVTVILQNGTLMAGPSGQAPFALRAIDKLTFTPLYLDNYGTIAFKVDDGKTTGCVITHDSGQMLLKRV